MNSYEYEDRPSYHNTNDWPTYGRERAASPYDPAITEANDRAIALALAQEDDYSECYNFIQLFFSFLSLLPFSTLQTITCEFFK